MKRILVTGSEGAFGQYLVKALAQHYPEAQIIRLSRSARPEIEHGDLTDATFVRGLFSRHAFTHVIHAAASPYRPDVLAKPSEQYRDDLAMTLNLLAESAKVEKFVFLSSSTVYEKIAAMTVKEEDADVGPAPTSAIGTSKSAGERAIRLFGSEHGVPWTIWRPFNIVSPLERHDLPGGHVFVDFYRSLFVEKSKVIRLRGDGSQVRSFLWVEDVADAVARFLDDKRTDNEVFNLGGNEACNTVELKDTMLRLGVSLGLREVGDIPKTEFEKAVGYVPAAKRLPDITKAERVLGWTPQTGLDACFRKFMEGQPKK